MKIEIKRWSQLGLSAAIAGSIALTACGGEGGEHGASVKPGAASVSTEGEGEGEGAAPAPESSEATTVVADGGEGEGGVAVEKAATDPVVFRAALAITEAHIIAARDAYAAGEKSAGGEMFAHPVSEVLFDVGPYLQMHGVENFDQLLMDASAACFDDETPEQISERTDAIIRTLRAAAKKAPSDGRTEAQIQVGVVSDQLDRAATMYGIASESDVFEPYLDGYGFYHAAANAYSLEQAAIDAEMPEAAAAINKALEVFAKAYPTALRPETLPGNAAVLTAAASGVILESGN